MKSIILLNRGSHSLSVLPGSGLEVYTAGDIKNAYLLNLEHPEVVAYVLDLEDFPGEQIKDIIENIHFLNQLITVFIHVKDEEKPAFLENTPKVHFFKGQEQLFRLLKGLPENHRKAHRADWPLKALYWKASKPKQIKEGKVLSLSEGGCFIQGYYPMEKNQEIVCTLKFRDFNFLTEGRVIRYSEDREPMGLAIEFKEISETTKEFIQRVIHEKLLSRIMDSFSGEETAGS